MYYNYSEARRCSAANPDKLVSFKEKSISPPITKVEGTMLDGELNGLVRWYFRSGSLECQCLYKNNEMHGECIYYNEYGKTSNHYFNINNERVEELDYLIDEDRDETFYVTLALYDIDKEYTIGG